MANAIVVRTYKSMPAEGKVFQWKNEHLFYGALTFGQYDDLNDFALRVANWEAYFHSSQVTFDLVQIGMYKDWAPPEKGAREHAFSLLHYNLRGAQTLENPAPFYYGLLWYKRALSGKYGKSLFFGCLDKSHYHEGSDGVPVFTAQNHFNLIMGDALNAYIDALVLEPVISTEPGKRPDGLPFRSYSWHLGHVTKQHAMMRKLGTYDTRMMELRDLIFQTVNKGAEGMRVLNFWRHEGHSFVDKGVKGQVMETLSAILAIDDKLDKLLRNGEPAKDGKYLRPIMRYGPSTTMLLQKSSMMRNQFEERQEAIGKVKPYTFGPDGNDYFTHDSTEMLEDMFKPILAEYSELLDADWKTDVFEEME